MKFEAGKCYGFKGSQAMVMFVAGRLTTKVFGDTLIGEVNIRGSLPALRAVGSEEKHAEGWEEIDDQMFLDVSAHWVDEFAEHHEKQASAQARNEELGIQTAFRKLVHIIKHPQRKSMTLQLMCGHTIQLTEQEWLKIPEDKQPKVGSMQHCGMCDIQNRAMAQNIQIEGMSKPEQVGDVSGENTVKFPG